MNKITNVTELTEVVTKCWMELETIKPEYLSETGLAAKEAYRHVLWYLGFYDTIQDIKDDESFNDLINVSGKHPEYYKIIKKINRAISRI